MHPNKLDELRTKIADLAVRAKLNDWTAFVRPLNIPREFAPAVITGRPELLSLMAGAEPREWNVAERRDMLKLTAGLIETNAALQEHAAYTAQLVDRWHQQFAGLESLASQIRYFGNFRHDDAADNDPIEQAEPTPTLKDQMDAISEVLKMRGEEAQVILFLEDGVWNGWASSPNSAVAIAEIGGRFTGSGPTAQAAIGALADRVLAGTENG